MCGNFKKIFPKTKTWARCRKTIPTTDPKSVANFRRPLQPQRTGRRHPPAFPPQRTRPEGHPPQASAGPSAPTDSPGRASVADFRRPQPAEPTKIRFFRGHAPRKKHLSALQCAAPLRGPCMPEGCNPQFWEGPRARQATRHPRVTGLPNEAQPFLAPPKIQNSAFPTVLGWGSTSRMLAMPVRYITIRSKPRPKPACLQEPNRRRSRYHQ